MTRTGKRRYTRLRDEKTGRLRLHVPVAELELIARAAELQALSVEEFVRRAALRSSHEALLDQAGAARREDDARSRSTDA